MIRDVKRTYVDGSTGTTDFCSFKITPPKSFTRLPGSSIPTTGRDGGGLEGRVSIWSSRPMPGCPKDGSCGLYLLVEEDRLI